MTASEVLIGRAELALDRLADQTGSDVEGEARRVARMMWLDGYKAGMDAVQTIADDSFRKLQADLA